MFLFRSLQISTFIKLLPVPTSQFFSTKNASKKFPLTNLGSVEFPDIVRSPLYVDKSLFIEAVIQCPAQHMLITAPRRFNKTVNIHMLKCFFQNKDYESLFAKLKIGNTSTMDLCGEIPVVWLNLKDGADVINSYEDAVRAVKISLSNAYFKHPYLMTSGKLSSTEMSIYESWTNNRSVASFDIVDVETGLLHLCRLVSKHFGRKCLLLVDEYDAICSAAYPNVDAKVLSNIIDFYSRIIGSVLKLNMDYVERGVLTGITRVMSAGLSSAINNVIPYPFMEDEYFVDYYGIQENEFDELMSREFNLSVRDSKQEALAYYNGYSAFGKKILNTWSVMNFLTKRTVKPYWVSSGVAELRLEKTCEKPLVRTVVEKLIRDEDVYMRDINFSAKSFKSFYEDFTDSKKNIVDCDPLLYFYLQQGYLSVSEKLEDEISVKIPNRELKKVFKSAMLDYFVNNYCIERKCLEKCASYIEKLDVRDTVSCEKVITSICAILEDMCNGALYTDHINETILRDFVFGMFYTAGFCPLSEIRIHKDGRKHKRPDICALRNDQAVIVEFKVNENEETAIDQILNKEYYQGFLNVPDLAKNEIKYFLLTGINLKKKQLEKGVENHQISACFLCNSLNRKDIVFT